MKIALGVVLALVVVSPAFAWAAGQVGYAEPLENAAEETGATGEARSINPGVLPDYAVPGANAHLGTFVSGLVGTSVVFVLALAIGRTLR